MASYRVLLSLCLEKPRGVRCVVHNAVHQGVSCPDCRGPEEDSLRMEEPELIHLNRAGIWEWVEKGIRSPSNLILKNWNLMK